MTQRPRVMYALTTAAVDRELMTEVIRLEYDCKTRAGRVFMAAHCCVDMQGAIDLFARLDPEVRQIETFAADVPDTRYRRDAAGGWCAYSPVEAAP